MESFGRIEWGQKLECPACYSESIARDGTLYFCTDCKYRLGYEENGAIILEHQPMQTTQMEGTHFQQMGPSDDQHIAPGDYHQGFPE